MRKLGLIGGMGPESTIPYYHDIVYGVQNKTKDGGLLTVKNNLYKSIKIYLYL
ncbi:hypothetical protein [uncultured Clostridium sp.]|uniref:hypothetical protein n=1 Tax=uncultured Clostridium sp. TaxID=59620 RepID=UPI0025FDE497|nr:hypothetical protein [uncultured Clostridium sp.]